jgi:hypothetical protein
VYSFLLTRTAGPRLNGYSPFVTPEADDALRAAAPLVQVPLDVCSWAGTVQGRGVDEVAVHLALFGPDRLLWDADGPAVVAALDGHPAFERVAEEGGVVRYRVDADRLACP